MPDALQQLLAKLAEYGLTPGLVGAIAAAGAVAIAAMIALRFVRARGRRTPKQAPIAAASIDTTNLNDAPPGPSNVELRLYHVPMRLAAVVVAPVGRAAAPPIDKLAEMLDQVTPGLMQVVDAHLPKVEIWPSQLSSSGFATTFFNAVRLPGDRGKGSPWCAVVGRFDYQGQKFLIGMALRSAANNGISQVMVEREPQWLDLLRITARE